VFIHSVAQTPHTLIGPCPIGKKNTKSRFGPIHFFIGANMRKQLNQGIGGYVLVFLSEVPLLFSRKILPIDVALIQVSPPDAHGYCSLEHHWMYRWRPHPVGQIRDYPDKPTRTPHPHRRPHSGFYAPRSQ
jgi:hypothetical protein